MRQLERNFRSLEENLVKASFLSPVWLISQYLTSYHCFGQFFLYFFNYITFEVMDRSVFWFLQISVKCYIESVSISSAKWYKPVFASLSWSKSPFVLKSSVESFLQRFFVTLFGKEVSLAFVYVAVLIYVRKPTQMLGLQAQ